MVSPSPELKVISDLGVFLLVIVAGMDVQPEDVRNSVKGRSVWIAILGFIVPIISGFIIGWAFHLEILITIFLSLCIAITALPVSIRILMDLGKLNTDIGHKIISAAVFNDIVSLLVLGIILDIRSNLNSISEMTYSIGIAIFKVALLTFILALAYKLFKLARQNVVFVKKQFDLFIGFLYGKESLFAIVILFVLIFASLTELAGLHFVVGAFFAALFLSKDILGFRNFIKVRNNTNVITMGFLAPIFFAGIGVQFNFSSINNFMLLLIVLLASVASKMAGGYFGGRLSGLGKYESVALGVGLNSRGIIELVIANIALSNGFIDKSLFSILVIMGLFTTLISPYLLKKSFSLIDKNN
jgi:Kef-type K+ transport system membrane component KefB